MTIKEIRRALESGMNYRSFEIPESACLECGAVQNRSSSFEGESASPGDIVLCIECSAIMAYGDDMTVRALTEEEMRSVAGSPELLRTQALLALYREHREKEGGAP